MAGFIPEITTTITVQANTEPLQECLDIMNNSEILSTCFNEISDYIQTCKDETEQLIDPVAEATANSLSAYQSQIISTKHKLTGMMMNSVDVMKDGDGVYLVGNTAMSVDGFPYPLAIEEGTSSHWVAPVTFDALHWKDKLTGEDRFSKGHMVSGIKADPFVDYSIQNLEDKIEEILNPLVNNVWRG